MDGLPLDDPELLLREDTFLRGLARALVGAGADADDAVQHAWLRAIESPPRRPGALPRWLAVVLRRNFSTTGVADAARSRRERAVARPEAVPSVAEVLAREEVRRRVVQEVVALPDAYRDVLLLRWFEDLAPAAIAARLGVPAATVRSRHARALALLRERLAARHCIDERPLGMALLPLARGGSVPMAVAAGAAIVATQAMKHVLVTLAAASLVLAGLGLFFFAARERTAVARSEPTAQPLAAAAAAPDASADTLRIGVPATPAADPVRQLRGVLRHANGEPAAGLCYLAEWGHSLRGASEDQSAKVLSEDAPRTDAEGRFEVALAADGGADAGLLWFDVAEGLKVVYALERDAAGMSLVLPATGTLRVECRGMRADDRLRLMVYPAQVMPDGEENMYGRGLLEIRSPAPGGPLAVLLEARDLRFTGPVAVELPALAGARYWLHPEGEGFLTEPHGGRYHVAPAYVAYAIGERFIATEVRVVETPGGTLASVGGHVVVHRHPALLVAAPQHQFEHERVRHVRLRGGSA